MAALGFRVAASALCKKALLVLDERGDISGSELPLLREPRPLLCQRDDPPTPLRSLPRPEPHPLEQGRLHVRIEGIAEQPEFLDPANRPPTPTMITRVTVSQGAS